MVGGDRSSRISSHHSKRNGVAVWKWEGVANERLGSLYSSTISDRPLISDVTNNSSVVLRCQTGCKQQLYASRDRAIAPGLDRR